MQHITSFQFAPPAAPGAIGPRVAGARFGREVDLLPLANELQRLESDLDDRFDVLFADIARIAALWSAPPPLGLRQD